MTDEPTGPERQLRALYADLVRAGATPASAQSAVMLTTLASGLGAAVDALNLMALDRYGDAVPARVSELLGHAGAAADTTIQLALGTMDLAVSDGE